MSLNWSMKKCKNFEKLTSEEMWPCTERVIFATMSHNIGRLTEKNLDDWCDRAKFCRHFFGVWSKTKDGDYYLEDTEFMRQYIGLSTNVPTVKSTGRWMTNRHKMLVQEREYQRRRAEEIGEVMMKDKEDV